MSPSIFSAINTHLNLLLVPRHPFPSLSSTRTSVPGQPEYVPGLRIQMFPKNIVQKKLSYDYVTRADKSNVNIISFLYHSDIIMQFYTNINEKKLKQIEGLLCDDCFFEDYSFPKPFQGKKEVLDYLEQLTTSMGQNIEYNVEYICEGSNNVATVYWHLDWKKSQIPFTRGCSYFELAKEGEHLVIKNIKALIESPLKPGGLALALLKLVNSLFDAFPEATERFLRSPHVIIQILLKIYNIFLKPIVSPLLAWYTKLWALAVGVLGLAFKVLQQIAKILNM